MNSICALNCNCWRLAAIRTLRRRLSVPCHRVASCKSDHCDKKYERMTQPRREITWKLKLPACRRDNQCDKWTDWSQSQQTNCWSRADNHVPVVWTISISTQLSSNIKWVKLKWYFSPCSVSPVMPAEFVHTTTCSTASETPVQREKQMRPNRIFIQVECTIEGVT